MESQEDQLADQELGVELQPEARPSAEDAAAAAAEVPFSLTPQCPWSYALRPLPLFLCLSSFILYVYLCECGSHAR
jgi:hypothetical protein